MTTPESHRRMSDWFSAHGRELREYPEKARERSIAPKASAEARATERPVLGRTARQTAGAAFGCRGVSNPPPGLQSSQVVLYRGRV